MKRKIGLFMLVLALALTSLPGCVKIPTDIPDKPEATNVPTPEPTPEPDYESLYKSIIEGHRNVITNYDSYADYHDSYQGTAEVASYEGLEALELVGYVFKDINSDGICELIIANTDADSYRKTTIYALYTLVDLQPTFVVSGRSRSSYALTKDLTLYYYGSNGAAYSLFGEYKLGENGALECIDYYFSYHKGNDYENIGFYHNTTGSYEVSESQELNISDEEFFALDDALSAKVINFQLTPLSEVESSSGTTGSVAATPIATGYYGNWTTTETTNDGYSYVLFVDIMHDGTASYRCGPPQSEILVDYTGTWTLNSSGNIILDMYDSYEGLDFYGEFTPQIQGDNLNLTHVAGDAFLYDAQEKTFSFSH